MSRIEDALRKARQLREINESNTKVQMPLSVQEQEKGIYVLILSKDPNISNIVSNIQSLYHGDITSSDNIVKGMQSLFEKWDVEVDEYELKFTARMLDMLCCNCTGATLDLNV